MQFLDWLYFGLLALLALAGVLVTALQFPGTWLIVVAAVVYDWINGWSKIGWEILAILVGLAVVGELLELATSAWAARRAGASPRAAWGAVIGGFVGMFVLTLPLPVIGTIAGAVLGCFVGAVVAELTVRPDIAHTTRVGVFSAAGRVLGLVGKLAIAFAMAALAVGTALLT